MMSVISSHVKDFSLSVWCTLPNLAVFACCYATEGIGTNFLKHSILELGRSRRERLRIKGFSSFCRTRRIWIISNDCINSSIRVNYFVHFYISWAGWPFGECFQMLYVYIVCLSVCLEVNQDGPNRYRYTLQRLVMLHVQTQWWTMIAYQKLKDHFATVCLSKCLRYGPLKTQLCTISLLKSRPLITVFFTFSHI